MLGSPWILLYFQFDYYKGHLGIDRLARPCLVQASCVILNVIHMHVLNLSCLSACVWLS